jgi:hypothetical protein
MQYGTTAPSGLLGPGADTWRDAATWLDGRVAVLQVPHYAGPSPATQRPGLKRLSLPQGDLIQFWDSPEGMRYIAAIQILPGKTRGNHFHRAKQETLYILEGKILLAFALPESQEVSEPASALAPVQLELGQGALVRIQPGIAHALKGIEPGYAIEASPTMFDPSDATAFPLLS